jgi:hypothetical protein
MVQDILKMPIEHRSPSGFGFQLVMMIPSKTPQSYNQFVISNSKMVILV